MAFDTADLNMSGGFDTKQKDVLRRAFSKAGTIATTAPVALTDSTGGSTAGSLAVITAGAAYLQSDQTAIKNAIARLNSQINALIAALKTSGVLK